MKKEVVVTFERDVRRMVLLKNNDESFVDTKVKH